MPRERHGPVWPPMRSSSPRATGHPVRAGPADEDVVAGVAGDEVVAPVGGRPGVDGGPGEEVVVEGHVERQPGGSMRQPVVLGVGVDLRAVDPAVVAEDEVVAGVAPDRVAAAAAEEQVVAEVALDGVADAVLRLDDGESHQHEGGLEPLEAHAVVGRRTSASPRRGATCVRPARPGSPGRGRRR